ncbi:glycoside hydrolase family 64 protein [Teratosphaeria destructans]|uniref:Glycoside hydrolase family 64 protein n=1 Tax=Teratosphaeria destructans TaxID=418781 RepID=A0A9W7SLE6_9PEZI|nr:glycoside hydrolase family 64 protein [Teratosphaeria destructans]
MPDSLQIALKNDSDLGNIHAYVTGIAIQRGGQRCMLKADGKDLYFPQDPPSIGSPLTEDCAIPLGPPGNTTTVTIPQIAGGRIWIAEGKLTFLLNPGPALVEPSVLNPSDPNAHTNFGFAEFTLNNDQLYANISYVDHAARIPIGISLQQASGQVQQVVGMAPDGLDRLADGLREQARKDGRPWDKLIVQHEGRILRVLNATHGDAVGASFDGYYEPHIEDVWQKYSCGACMRINTQAGPGVLEGRINENGELVIGNESFGKPNSADVFGCNSGPFTTGPNPDRNAIIPRLAAAFHRSTLLATEDHPSDPSTFYRQDPTNHYARLVHEVNLDRKGYAFAYDDVQPDGGEDQSGKVNAGDPTLLTVTVGGKSAAAGGQGGGGQAAPKTYDRPPPPPPPVVAGDQHDEGGGFRDRVKGFAQKILK